MECALTNLQELSLVLQKYSHLLIFGRVWIRETSRKSMSCDVSCWNKNEKRPMWDSWVLKIHNCSVFEPAFLSSTLYLAPTAVISMALSPLLSAGCFLSGSSKCCVGCWLARFHQLQQGVTVQTAHIHRVTPKNCKNIICSSHLPPPSPALKFQFKAVFYLYLKIRFGLINTFI